MCSRLGMGSCLMDLIASAWVAAFVSKKALERENKQLSMCAVQKDLDLCYSKLTQRAP